MLCVACKCGHTEHKELFVCVCVCSCERHHLNSPTWLSLAPKMVNRPAADSAMLPATAAGQQVRTETRFAWCARGHGLVTCNAIYRTLVRVRTVKTNNHGTTRHGTAAAALVFVRCLVHLRGKVNTLRARHNVPCINEERLWKYLLICIHYIYTDIFSAQSGHSSVQCAENVIEIIAYCMCVCVYLKRTRHSNDEVCEVVCVVPCAIVPASLTTVHIKMQMPRACVCVCVWVSVWLCVCVHMFMYICV